MISMDTTSHTYLWGMDSVVIVSHCRRIFGVNRIGRNGWRQTNRFEKNEGALRCL